MSLRLNLGTVPEDLETKAWPGHVEIGEYSLSLKDFLGLALYVLGNTDLVEDDPRRAFVERVRSMEEVPGWDLPQTPNAKRLEVRPGPTGEVKPPN